MSDTRRAIRALVVEKSQDGAESAVDELRHAGYDVAWQWVGSPGELRLALGCGEWDIVLSGPGMARFGWLSIPELLRSIEAEIPLIIVSAEADEEMTAEAIRAGAGDYVLRGNLHRLGIAIDRALREADALRERKRGGLAMAEVMEAIRHGIVVIGTDGRIKYVNAQLLEQTGLSKQEVMGKTPVELGFLSDEESRRIGDDIIPEVIKVGHVWAYEFEACRSDGTTFPALIDFAVARDTSGEPAGIVCVIRDVSEVKQIQAALEESAWAYQSIIENMIETYYRTDVAGDIIMVSPSGPPYLGYDSVEEMLRLNLARDVYLNPEDREAFLQAVMKEGSVRSYPVTLKTKDGRTVHGETSSRIWYDSHGNPAGVEGVIRDVTDRNRAEEALGKSEERCRELLENAGDLIQSVDEQGRFGYVNPAWIEALGYSQDEAQQLRFTDIVAPEDLGHCSEMYLEVMRGTRFSDVHTAFLAKDGRRIQVEGNVGAAVRDGKAVGTLGVFRDVTRRMEAEEALRENERRFRKVIEMLPFPVCVRAHDGETAYINLRFTDVFGYTISEIPPDDAWLEPVDPQNESHAQAVSVIEVERETIGDHEMAKRTFFAKRKDGEERIVTLRSLRIVEEEEYLVFHDITRHEQMQQELREAHTELERRVEKRTSELAMANETLRREVEFRKEAEDHQRRLSEELQWKSRAIEESRAQLQTAFEELDEAHTKLQRSQEQLVQSEKLAAIGELVSGVAHELNNPLMTIHARAELLLMNTDDSETQARLEIILSEAKRSMDIIENLLSFARRHPGRTALVSVAECIESAIRLRAHELMLDKIQIEVSIVPDLPQIEADSQQLTQVFLNLIGNAAYAMKEAHDGGTLTVMARSVGGTVEISFADDGPGIPPDVLENIFAPFFTTKPAGKGTGLGLSISHSIIQNHGGTIHAESTLGKGTILLIELPAADEIIGDDTVLSTSPMVRPGLLNQGTQQG